jgi:hypothetical protein
MSCGPSSPWPEEIEDWLIGQCGLQLLVGKPDAVPTSREERKAQDRVKPRVRFAFVKALPMMTNATIRQILHERA